MKKTLKFFLVREDILPEAIAKTAYAKELVENGQVNTINEAVDVAGIGRSTFYKYRDGVFSLRDPHRKTIVTLSLSLEHTSGVLSKVLNTIARFGGNILTINQGIPLKGIGHVTISADMSLIELPLEKLLQELNGLTGVIKTEIVGKT